jgi:hypothetical protein
LLVHPDPEVSPPSLRYGFVVFGYLRRLFLKDVEQDEEIVGSSIEDAEQATSVVTSQFSQLTFHLTGVREGQRGVVFSQVVQAINLHIQRGLHACGKAVDEFIDRF